MTLSGIEYRSNALQQSVQAIRGMDAARYAANTPASSVDALETDDVAVITEQARVRANEYYGRTDFPRIPDAVYPESPTTASMNSSTSANSSKAGGSGASDDWLARADKAWSSGALTHRLTRTADGQTVLGRATTKQKEAAERIRSALKKNGVNLLPKERFELEVGKDGTIEVNGLKDPVKARRIARILNEDPELAGILRQAKLYGAAAAGQKSGAQGRIASVDEMNLDRATRQALLADYLRDEFDVDMAELGLEGDETEGYRLTGANTALSSALAEDQELELALHGILYGASGEGAYSCEPEPFTLEFSNGMVVDPVTRAKTQDSVKDIRRMFFQAMANYNDEAEKAWRMNPPPGVDAKTLEQLIESSKFHPETIEIAFTEGGAGYSGRVGEVEPPFGQGAVSAKKSMDRWLADVTATGLVSDMFEQMLVCHQAEYGDVDDEQHSVSMTLTAGSAVAAVSSPEADDAIMDTARRLADAMGKAAGDALRNQGIVNPAFDIRVQEDGRLVAVGGHGSGQAELTALIGEANVLAQFDGDASLRDASDPDGEEGGKNAIDADVRKRKDGFMIDADEQRRLEKGRERRQANYREGPWAENGEGLLKPFWVGTSPENMATTDRLPGGTASMPAVNGIDTITVSPAEMFLEADKERRRDEVESPSAERMRNQRSEGIRRESGENASLGKRRTLNTGLAEFSREDPSPRMEAERAIQQLSVGAASASTLRGAADVLTRWLGQLHDPSRAETLLISVR